jgi:hypothetical protein
MVTSNRIEYSNLVGHAFPPYIINHPLVSVTYHTDFESHALLASVERDILQLSETQPKYLVTIIFKTTSVESKFNNGVAKQAADRITLTILQVYYV